MSESGLCPECGSYGVFTSPGVMFCPNCERGGLPRPRVQVPMPPVEPPRSSETTPAEELARAGVELESAALRVDAVVASLTRAEPSVPVSRLEELAVSFVDTAAYDDAQYESLAAATWRQAAEDLRALITEYQEPQRG